jgi:hypothetical protein
MFNELKTKRNTEEKVMKNEEKEKEKYLACDVQQWTQSSSFSVVYRILQTMCFCDVFEKTIDLVIYSSSLLFCWCFFFESYCSF